MNVALDLKSLGFYYVKHVEGNGMKCVLEITKYTSGVASCRKLSLDLKKKTSSTEKETVQKSFCVWHTWIYPS